MSKFDHSDRKEVGVLRVSAPPDVNVTVTKGLFEEVANVFGDVELSLGVGIYTVRWHSEGMTSQQVVRLMPGADATILEYSNSDEHSFANDISRGLDSAFGTGFTGSALVIGVRTTSKSPSSYLLQSLRIRPASVHREERESLGLGETVEVGETVLIAHTISPGSYILSYRTVDRRIIEQAVYVFPLRITVAILGFASALVPEAVQSDRKLRSRWGFESSATRLFSIPSGKAVKGLETSIRLIGTLLDRIAKDTTTLEDQLYEVVESASDPYFRLYAIVLLLGSISAADLADDQPFAIDAAISQRVTQLLEHAGLDPLGDGADVMCIFWRLTLAGVKRSTVPFSALECPPMLERSWQWATIWSTAQPGEGALSKSVAAASAQRLKSFPWLTWRSTRKDPGLALADDVISVAQTLAEEVSLKFSSFRENVSSSSDVIPSHKSSSLPELDLSRLSRAARRVVANVATSSATSRSGMNLLEGLVVSLRKPVSMVVQQVQSTLDEISNLENKASAEKAEGSDDLFNSDPHKGKFGGRPEANNLVLELEDWGESNDPEYLALKLVVRPTGKREPIDGLVRFHLHPTFNPAIELVRCREGKAKFTCYAMGGFTIGAEIGDGTKLELDLAEIGDLPEWFRSR